MNKQITKYLKSNKDKYSREQLVEALKKAGHSERDIQKGVEAVYRPQKEQTGFWDFKTRKYYAEKKEKVLDFIVGVVLFFALTYIIFGIVTNLLLSFLSLSSGFSDFAVLVLIQMGIFLLVVILALIFLFIKRRFMFYGLLTGFLCFIVFAGYIIFRFFTTPLY